MQSTLFDRIGVERITLRPYQRAAVDAVYAHLRTREDNPCLVLPTGSGKTPVIATICKDAVTQWHGRVLVLAHVKELLQQSADKLAKICPGVPVGLYSAGLGRKEMRQPITVAGIQSIYSKACDFDPWDIVLIDEAHLIPPDGEGMYRTFLHDAKKVNPNVRVVGLTATPFRMKSGMICQSESILNHVCYDIGVRELIVQGYLSPLTTKGSKTKVNTNDLAIRAGEFKSDEAESLMNTDKNVLGAVGEIVEKTADRKACLIFAAGVKHGQHIVQVFNDEYQVECGFVTGDTSDGERARLLSRFLHGELKYLCNVNVLTTGFDAPNIDCVALLRPTNSPGLYYQMVGRGFRLAEGKHDCLVLDFANNVKLHGPVDMLNVSDGNRRANGESEAPAKECPQCNALIAAGYASCPECCYEFPPPEKDKHDRNASDAAILSDQVEAVTHRVDQIYYSLHKKRGAEDDAPRTLRVDYQINLNETFSEWVCLEHEGWPKQKAVKWWTDRSPYAVPLSIEEAVEIAESGWLAKALEITVREVGEKFPRIVGYRLAPKPELGDAAEFEPAQASSESFDDIPF